MRFELSTEEEAIECLEIQECGGLRAHSYNPGVLCCVYASEAPVHDLSWAHERRRQQRKRIADEVARAIISVR